MEGGREGEREREGEGGREGERESTVSLGKYVVIGEEKKQKETGGWSRK